MRKNFTPPTCTTNLCPYFGKCALLMTEIVCSRDDNDIDIMFVGQGAGEKEHLTHKPFTGPAGRLLREKLLPKILSNKLNIVLDNTIRCRPLDEKGKNRPPTKEEVLLCLPYLWKQIEELKPLMVVPLGASAAGDLVPMLYGKSITSVRGKKYNYNGYTFLPTFHPAAILHCRDEETVQNYHTKIDQDIQLAIYREPRQMELI